MQTILFICTGNYYRSRFAEILFNQLVRATGLKWQADSRGVRLSAANQGPISPYALRRLQELGIDLGDDIRHPRQLAEVDLSQAHHVVALKELEHRVPLEQNFPQWAHRVEYWKIDDIDCAEPHDALPLLEQQLKQLLERLSALECSMVG